MALRLRAGDRRCQPRRALQERGSLRPSYPPNSGISQRMPAIRVFPFAGWSLRRSISFIKLTRESSTSASSTSRPLARWVVDAFHYFRERRYRVAVMGATVVCSRNVMSGKVSPLLMPAVTVIFLRLALLSSTRERPFTCPSVSEVVALLAAKSNSAPDSRSPGVWGHGLRFIRLRRSVGGARTRCRQVSG